MIKLGVMMHEIITDDDVRDLNPADFKIKQSLVLRKAFKAVFKKDNREIFPDVDEVFLVDLFETIMEVMHELYNVQLGKNLVKQMKKEIN